MAVLWVDRERWFFIATASKPLPGVPCERLRWRQVGDRAARVAFTIPEPQVAELYYRGCAAIDHHNQCRQDDLQLERKLASHDWSMGFNLSLMGFFIADSWMLYAGARGATGELSQAEYYEALAGPLIDNTFDSLGPRGPSSYGEAGAADEAVPLRFGVGVHLTPTL